MDKNQDLHWHSLLGHERIKADLQALLRHEKLPHALLFVGVEGIGKKLMGLLLAKALLTKDYTLTENSNQAQQFDNYSHPDFILIEPDSTKANPSITIPQIRAMQNTLAQSAYYEGYRIVLIDQAHTLNETAMNALLKTLEEPFGDVVFILITHLREKLLPTILSRCTQVYFGPLPPDILSKLLLKDHQLSPEQAHLLAIMANGSYTNCEKLLKDTDNLRDLAIKFVQSKLTPTKIWDYTEQLLNISKKDNSNSKEKIQLWGQYLLMYLRDLLCLQGKVDQSLIYHQDKYPQLSMDTWNYSPSQLFAKIDLTEKLLQNLQTNAELSRALQYFMLKWRQID